MTKLADVRKWNQPYDVPDPTALSTYQRDIYSSFGKPIFSTKPEEWEQLAKDKVPAENFGYVYGSASSFKTYKAVRSVSPRYWHCASQADSHELQPDSGD